MAHGGKREGAGRKKLSNKYKEQTCPVRIPLSLLPTVQVLLQKKHNNIMRHTRVIHPLSHTLTL